MGSEDGFRDGDYMAVLAQKYRGRYAGEQNGLSEERCQPGAVWDSERLAIRSGSTAETPQWFVRQFVGGPARSLTLQRQLAAEPGYSGRGFESLL